MQSRCTLEPEDLIASSLTQLMARGLNSPHCEPLHSFPHSMAAGFPRANKKRENKQEVAVPFMAWPRKLHTITLLYSNSLEWTSPGTSLVVQWLRLHARNVGGLSSIPGQGTRSYMSQRKILNPATKIKDPNTATKSQHSQIKINIFLNKEANQFMFTGREMRLPFSKRGAFMNL